MIKIIPILYLLSTITLIGCDGDIQLKESGITRKIVDKNTTDNSSTPENCVDPDLSGIHTSITVVLCSGETARGLLNLTNLKSENLKENITVGGISGSLIPDSATFFL